MLSIHSSSSHTTTFFSLYFLILSPYHCALRLTRLLGLVIAFRYDWSLALDHWVSLQACPLFISILLGDRTGLDFISARNILGWCITWVSVWRLDWSSTRLSARSSTRTFLMWESYHLYIGITGHSSRSSTRSSFLMPPIFPHLHCPRHHLEWVIFNLGLPLQLGISQGVLLGPLQGLPLSPPISGPIPNPCAMIPTMANR